MNYWKQEGERRMAAASGFTERVIQSKSGKPSTFQDLILYEGNPVPELNRCFSKLVFRKADRKKWYAEGETKAKDVQVK